MFAGPRGFMRKFKVNDKVIVRTGHDKGKIGTILKINYKVGKAIVDGINARRKAVPPDEKTMPMGGHIDVYARIDLSNIALVDPKTNKAVRVGLVKEGDKFVRVTKDGSKL
jgi:large subunit ribosomal protein L24